MRFGTPVYFQQLTRGAYNKATGNYEDGKPIESKRYASVTDTGAETLNLIYGEIKQNSKTVRIHTHYTDPFDRIRIGEKVYRVDMSRLLRNMHTFVVSEV